MKFRKLTPEDIRQEIVKRVVAKTGLDYPIVCSGLSYVNDEVAFMGNTARLVYSFQTQMPELDDIIEEVSRESISKASGSDGAQAVKKANKGRPKKPSKVDGLQSRRVDSLRTHAMEEG